MKKFDEKNFRSSFYNKVGLAKDEEKIDALLQTPDLDKIRMFIKTYSISDSHRIKIWKLLFGMTTPNGGNNEYTSGLRKTSYDNLYKCLTVLNKINDNTSAIEKNILLWKLENQNSKINYSEENLMKISEVFVKCIKTSDEDLYFLFKNFINLITNYQQQYPQLVEEVFHMIAKKDIDYEKFLRTTKINETIQTIFSRCFAGILDPHLTIRLWDKVVAGYFRLILPKIVFFILTENKNFLIDEKDNFSILLKPIPKDQLDPRIFSFL